MLVLEAGDGVFGHRHPPCLDTSLSSRLLSFELLQVALDTIDSRIIVGHNEQIRDHDALVRRRARGMGFDCCTGLENLQLMIVELGSPRGLPILGGVVGCCP